jgi:hypothetical protein
MSGQLQVGWEWSLTKRKRKISPVSQEQRNKKGFLMKLQKHCGEQGFWRRRWPFPSIITLSYSVQSKSKRSHKNSEKVA